MSTSNPTINLDSDSDSDDLQFFDAYSDRESTIESPDSPDEVVELDDDDDHGSDLEEDVDGQGWHDQQLRRVELPAGHVHIDHFMAYGTYKLRPGMNVPLLDGSFFRIRHLTKDRQTQNISLHGWMLKRPKDTGKQISRTTGELVLQIIAEEQDKREDLVRGLEEIAIQSVDFASELDRKIIFTNQSKDVLRDPRAHIFERRQEVWTSGTLFCRIKNVLLFSVKHGRVTKPNMEAWKWLREHEVDAGYGVPDVCKTQKWRNGRPAASRTSKARSSSSESIFMERQTKRSKTARDDGIVEIEESEYHRVEVKKTVTRLGSITLDEFDDETEDVTLTAADICCGAGGVSGALQEVGFKIVAGVDHWHPAAETFRLNFPNATVYEMGIFDFITGGPANSMPDCHVLHISWPCPFYSPAHTRSNNEERDDRNRFTNFATEPLLKAVRPMFVTFENTSGLKDIGKHRQDFDLLIKSLTDLGWSVVFKVTKLSDYGASQKRRRLILIAACPGMPLIDFPLPTYGTHPDLLPLTTVKEAIRGVNRRDPLHNSTELRRQQRKRPSTKLRPADADAPLRHLISTSGPGALNPSGRRRFTYREGMRLMGLSDTHKLSPAARTSKDKWTLIGNGFPPQLPKIIHGEIYKVLQQWFAKQRAPIALDDGADHAPTPAASRVPSASRKRKSREASVSTLGGDAFERPATPVTPGRVLASPRSHRERRRSGDVGIRGALPVGPATAPPARRQGWAARPSFPPADEDVVDLTMD